MQVLKISDQFDQKRGIKKKRQVLSNKSSHRYMKKKTRVYITTLKTRNIMESLIS